MNFLKFSLVLILVKCSTAYINMTEYYKMPKLYLLDDYDRCLDEFDEKSVYCYVDVLIKPNKSSIAWSYIEKYSKNETNSFRHDRLKRGVCINWCKKKLNEYTLNMKMEYYEPFFEKNLEVLTYHNALEHRIKYNKLLNQCINLELKKQYSLMGYANVDYCTSNRDTFETDSVDQSFLIITSIILLIITISTFYDYRLKNLKPLNLQSEHYKKSVKGDINTVITSFSLIRNFNLLNAKGPSAGATQNLQTFQGIRLLITFCVILAHIIFVFNLLPIENPDYFEKAFDEFYMIILLNGPLTIQTFFCISGFLLSVQFLEFKETNPIFQMRYYWRGIIYRYTRLMPVYAYLMLLSGTWMKRMQSGPVWRSFIEGEEIFCRNNWWTNALLINNYVHADKACMQQGWYLAAEFQLFIFSLSILMLIWRYPKSVKKIFSFAFFIVFLSPAIVTYINKFDGMFKVTPETQKYMHFFEPTYLKLYIPGHTNGGGYLCGLLAGYIYYNYRQNISFIKNKIFLTLWYLSVPICVLLLLSGSVFRTYDVTKPAIWISTYAGLTKIIWGSCFGIIFIGFALGKGWKIRDILQNNIFNAVGRMSFCVYLVHTLVMRVTLGYMRQPIFVGISSATVAIASTFFLSYIMAFFLCIMLELPISSIQRLIFKKCDLLSQVEVPIETKRSD